MGGFRRTKPYMVTLLTIKIITRRCYCSRNTFKYCQSFINRHIS